MAISIEVINKMNQGTHKCDICDGLYEAKDRHYVVQVRPSDPTELVAVMWTGPCCAKDMGALSRKGVEEYFQKHSYENGGKLVFNSVY